MARDSTQNTAVGAELALLNSNSTCRIFIVFPNISLDGQGTLGVDHS
jgi:hypothetical protein